MTIVVSTAYMDEANRCDRVAMMKSGKFLAIDSPSDIISKFDKSLVAVRSDDMFRLLHDLRSMPETDRCYTFGDTHHVTLKDGTSLQAGEIAARLTGEYRHSGVEARLVKASLEDCYMNLEDR